MVNSNKKKFLIIISIVFSAIIIGISCILLIISLYNPLNKPAENKVFDEQKYEYIVKTENNQIFVLKKGSDSPFYTLSTPLHALPEKDQEAVKKGIYLVDKKELDKLLEDYDD